MNLNTDEGLKQACETVADPGSWGDERRQWAKNVAETVRWVRATSREGRETREFQERLWEDNRIAAIGQGRIPVDRALDDAGFRSWLAERSLLRPATHGAFTRPSEIRWRRGATARSSGSTRTTSRWTWRLPSRTNPTSDRLITFWPAGGAPGGGAAAGRAARRILGAGRTPNPGMVFDTVLSVEGGVTGAWLGRAHSRVAGSPRAAAAHGPAGPSLRLQGTLGRWESRRQSQRPWLDCSQ
jgi:hypothetical protein